LLGRYHDLLQQMVLTDPVPHLKTIEAPTLLLWGEQDAMIPVRNAQDYLKSLGKSRLVTLPGVGRLPQEEAPERALQPVCEFLAE
jgi:pimeloyl-ACP methyl ester carboxylesterase